MIVVRLSLYFYSFCAAWAIVPVALAEDAPIAPQPEAIQEVFEYYQRGSSVVLNQQALCDFIGKNPPHRFECIGSMDPDVPLSRFKEAYFWTTLLTPSGYNQELEYRFFHNDNLHSTSKITVSPSLRYRTWKFLLTHLSGTWVVQLVEKTIGGENIVASATYIVE